MKLEIYLQNRFGGMNNDADKAKAAAQTCIDLMREAYEASFENVRAGDGDVWQGQDFEHWLKEKL